LEDLDSGKDISKEGENTSSNNHATRKPGILEKNGSSLGEEDGGGPGAYLYAGAVSRIKGEGANPSTVDRKAIKRKVFLQLGDYLENSIAEGRMNLRD